VKDSPMTASLWPPNLFAQPQPRGMREMLVDAVGDISAQTNREIEFYVDLLGVGPSGVVEKLRYNCYLRAVKTGYLLLFFQSESAARRRFAAGPAGAGKMRLPRAGSYAKAGDPTCKDPSERLIAPVVTRTEAPGR
jgi:hypothetical protein